MVTRRGRRRCAHAVGGGVACDDSVATRARLPRAELVGRLVLDVVAVEELDPPRPPHRLPIYGLVGVVAVERGLLPCELFARAAPESELFPRAQRREHAEMRTEVEAGLEGLLARVDVVEVEHVVLDPDLSAGERVSGAGRARTTGAHLGFTKLAARVKL